jgi:phage tail-like protein
MASVLVPLHIFRFQVDFYSDSLPTVTPQGAVVESSQHEVIKVCSGAFSECTGLEATMEPKTIKEGGRNYGAAQRAGGITFATVVLKRGISTNRNLWQIFNSFAAGKIAPRLQVVITLRDANAQPITGMGWQLNHAMPVKFKFADLNAKGTEVGIEELHLVHEGLSSR